MYCLRQKSYRYTGFLVVSIQGPSECETKAVLHELSSHMLRTDSELTKWLLGKAMFHI